MAYGEQWTGARSESTDENGPAPSYSCRLVPFSGLQFIDFEIDAGLLALTHNRFVEDSEEGRGSVLIPLTVRPDVDGAEWHPVTQAALTPAETLWVTGYAAVEPFLGTWMPLPVLRRQGQTPDGSPRYDCGPSNWARV